MPNIRRILKEFIENDLDWIENTQSSFDPNFTFIDKEYWIDISLLSKEEKLLVGEYITKTLKTYSLHQQNGFLLNQIGSYSGFVVHCGVDENDYEPERGRICFMDVTFDEDEYNSDSIYVDGREVLEYAKLIGNEETLEESMGWSDKDSISWDTDKNFSNDPYNINDPNWTSTPEKSYWVQGGGGGASSGGEETVKEVEDLLDNEDDFDWVRDIKEFPNYNGFPQGVVYVDSHMDIDVLEEIVRKLNPKDFTGRAGWDEIRRSLEGRRDEIEEDGGSYDDAVVSVSIFVERNNPEGLSIGYWSYDVDEGMIREWLNYGDTFNKEYKLYHSVYDFKKDIENLTI
jgi:hypothetical protein